MREHSRRLDVDALRLFPLLCCDLGVIELCQVRQQLNHIEAILRNIGARILRKPQIPEEGQVDEVVDLVDIADAVLTQIELRDLRAFREKAEHSTMTRIEMR